MRHNDSERFGNGEGKPFFYVDQDGVLANFHEGVQSWLGYNWHSFAGQKEQRNLSTYGTRGFWESLPLMPDAQVLWWALIEHDPIVLTAYPYQCDNPKEPNALLFRENAERGKLKWLKTHRFGIDQRNAPKRFICVNRTQKRQFATYFDTYLKTKVANVLIDDNEQTIKEWEEDGGHGILYTNLEDTMRELKKKYGIDRI